MPVYQAQAYLNRAIDSVLHQSFPDFELLLYNDGSTDGSAAICRAAAEKDPRVRYIEQENRGQAAVRNRGMDEAAGDYIAFADSDDFCHPDWLRVLYEKAQKTCAEITLCGYRMQSASAGSDVFAAEGIVTAENLAEHLPELKEKNLIDPPWNKLYQTAFLRRTGVHFPTGEIYEDTDFNLRLLQHQPTVAVSERCLYTYLLHEGSTTRRYDERKWQTLKRRVDVLRELLPENRDFCASCWLRFFVSSHADMFLSLPKKEIRRRMKEEIKTQDFCFAAQNAVGQGKTGKITALVAKSGRLWLIYGFCRFTYFLKYKMQKIFLRVRG